MQYWESLESSTVIPVYSGDVKPMYMAVLSAAKTEVSNNTLLLLIKLDQFLSDSNFYYGKSGHNNRLALSLCQILESFRTLRWRMRL